MALKAAKLADEKKALDVIVLDLRKLTNITDYFVVCSGESDTQVRAISGHIIEQLRKEKVNYFHCEGEQNAVWILIDYSDVVIHIFELETRQYYELERLWGDGELIYGKLPV